jgi:ribose/xylose/arabinose/galactoside ABC-type transport system permease subunit
MLSKAVLNLGGNAYFQIGAFLFASLLLYIFLEKTRYGRYIKSIGTNIEVARFSGINIRFYTLLTYIICGLFTALGGFMLTAYEGVVRIGAGEGYLIDSFVFPILGQAVFRRISVEGTLFGALFMYMILNGLYIFGTTPENTDFIKGGLVLIVLIISGLQKLKGN